MAWVSWKTIHGVRSLEHIANEGRTTVLCGVAVGDSDVVVTHKPQSEARCVRCINSAAWKSGQRILTVRLPANEHGDVMLAARAAGMSMNAFCVKACLAAAEKTLTAAAD